jgi:hypothetical protein
MKYILLLFCVVFFLTARGQDSTYTIKYVNVPGTDLRVVPPAYFRAVPEIQGFIHPGTSASISFTTTEGVSFLQVCEGITSEYLAKQDVVLISKENVKTSSGMDGVLFLVGFTAVTKDSAKTSVQYERLMLFTGDYQKTIWVNANYPVALKKILLTVLRESILTVDFSNKD